MGSFTMSKDFVKSRRHTRIEDPLLLKKFILSIRVQEHMVVDDPCIKSN